MHCVGFLLLCAIGIATGDSGDGKLSTFLHNIANFQRKQHGNDGERCNHADRKNHAIALLQEWVKHNHYEAIEKLYMDIYHHDLSSQSKRQWHHYQSTFDEAFTHGNTDPDYFHVESYIRLLMNSACRMEIMTWIENLAKTHTNTAAKTTHAPHQTHKPVTHAAHTPKPTTHAPKPTTTHQPTTTMAAISVKTACEAVTFVTALARGTILTNANAGLCTDGTNSRPEALVLQSCTAPNVATWKQGQRVMDNCKGIPDYTPVGMFTFGTFVQDGSAVAGIITDCTANGFKIAIQLCGHPVNIYDLVSGATDPKQNADNYYVIDW